MKPTSSTLPRVLVVGLDGGTFDVLTPLAEAGVMPNLARFMRKAALAQLQSTEPAITPAAWTTFQTGCNPLTHGIVDFRYLDHATGEVLYNHAGRIAQPTLFDHVAAAGSASVSINLPMTSAERASPESIIVGGLDSHSAAAVLRPYPKLARCLREKEIAYSLRVIWKRRPQSFEELSVGVADTIAAFRSRTEAALATDAMSDWRLMVVQFQNLDSLQHRCWHLLGLDQAGGGSPEWVAKTREAMTALDHCLGDLFELADRQGAGVVVLSDHGFGEFREKICVSELLRRNGYLREGMGSRMRYRAARSSWKLKKWVRRRLNPGLNTARLVRHPEMLLPIDWHRSAATCLHGNLAGLVYLNTPARFGRGGLTTESQRQRVATELVEMFLDAKHPDTGEPLFADAYRTGERLNRDPVEAMLPEVIAIPSPGFHTRQKFDAAGRLMRGDPSLTGTHRAEGVLMLGVPGATIGRRYHASLCDVAPTILHLLGLPVGSEMQGEPLVEMFDRNASVAETPGSISPFRPRQPEPARLAHQSEKVAQRLKELGYLE